MSEEPQYWSDRVLSQGQGDRFDRWVEFLGALVLAVATVATAWSAYQAALWGGDESKFYFEVSAAQLEAAEADEYADEHVFLTAIFATVLFFSGVSGKFQWCVIDRLILGIGVLVLLVGLVMLAQMPVQ